MNEVKALQQCQLNILKDLKRVCEQYDIPFYLAYGTCIGAYRHQGFIPWDDDVDICMLWSDLEKLKQHASELSSRYFLQCNDTDPEYGLMITRIRDSQTTLIEQEEADRDINHGIFLDIYPLFPTYKSNLRALPKIVASYIYRLFLYGRAPYHHGKMIRAVSNFLLTITTASGKKRLQNKCVALMKKENESGYVSIFYGRFVEPVYNKEWLFPTKNMKFENEDMPVPKEVEKVLTLGYGDFMKLPPEDQRKPHHDYIFMDPLNSYKVYKGIKYCREKQK